MRNRTIYINVAKFIFVFNAILSSISATYSSTNRKCLIFLRDFSVLFGKEQSFYENVIGMQHSIAR